MPSKDCSDIGHYVIPSGLPTYLSSMGLPTIITNKKFVVEGDLMIDVNTEFNNCQFKIKNGSRIFIATTSNVGFTCSYLYSCNTTWGGIVINNNNAKFSLHYSKIENALTGVDISSKTNLQFYAYNNDFYNNRTGIKVTGNSSFTFNDITGNHFHGSRKATDYYTDYGIYVEGTSTYQIVCHVGDYSRTPYAVVPNQFYNMYKVGIYMKSAESQIHGCKFYNFYNGPTLDRTYGVGVYSENSYVIIRNKVGDPTSYNPISFDNLNYGFFAYKSNNQYTSNIAEKVEISSCASHAAFGNYANFTAEAFVVAHSKITQNINLFHEFYDTGKRFHGIYFNKHNSLYDFGGNIFTTTANPGYPSTTTDPTFQLRIKGSGIAASPRAIEGTIYNSEFYNSVQYASSMIVENNLNCGISIEDNIFDYTANGHSDALVTKWQLALLDVSRGTVLRNIFNDSHSDDNIHIQGCYSYLFCQNQLNKALYGMHSMLNNNIDLAQTDFGDHTVSLFLDYDGVTDPIIGVQYDKENCWNNASPFFDAVNEATTIPFVLLSEFKVDPSIATCHLPPSYTPILWFDQQPRINKNACEDQQMPALLLMGPGNDLSWENQYEWYRVISERVPENEYETQLLQNLQGSGIALLLEKENELSQIISINETELNQISGIKDQQSEIDANIDAIRSSDDELTEAMIDQINALIAQRDQLTTDLNVLLENQQANAMNNVNALIAEISSLSFDKAEENTYKNYLLLIAKAHSGQYEQEEIEAMAGQIAYLDPGTHGHGARKAKFYLEKDLLDAYIEEVASHCGHEFNINKPVTPEVVNPIISTEFNVIKVEKNKFELRPCDDKLYNYSVVNINGNIVYSLKNQLGNTVIDLSILPTGYYYIINHTLSSNTKVLVEP